MGGFADVRGSFWDQSTPAPPATAAGVAQAEAELRVRLPVELVELLTIQNGGAVAAPLRAFPTATPNSWAADHVSFPWLAGTEPSPWGTALTHSPYLRDEWGLPDGLVLISGDGHDFIALDYRRAANSGQPDVTWFDTDDLTEIPLAASFRDFVEGLSPESRFTINE